MATRKYPSQDEELLIAKIKELLQRIQYEEDPSEMDLLRRIYKKNVPIFRRAYFSAMLLRELAQSEGIGSSESRRPGKSSRPETRSSKREQRREKKITGKQKQVQQEEKNSPKDASENLRSSSDIPSTVPAENEDPNTLFVSIGKNRRVFPRDLIGLFSSVDGVDPEKIGDIRILDNYSFVGIDPNVAPDIIVALHSSEYRGRKLTVNFARKKN